MKAYEIKVKLQGTEPLVWRQITIPCNVKCKDLANILLIAMGWENGAMSRMDFFVPKLKYEEERTLEYYLEKSKCFLVYYDLGTFKEHKCMVTKVIEQYPYSYPMINQAVGMCPSVADNQANVDYDMQRANTLLKKYFISKKDLRSPLLTLFDVLMAKTVAGLRQIARDFELVGYSKLRKKDLIDFICERLLDHSYLNECFLYMDQEDYLLFEKVVREPLSIYEVNRLGLYIDWLKEGLFIYQNEDKIYAVNEFKAFYESVNYPHFRREKERINQIIMYEDALLNLYGICPIESLVDIYNRHQAIAVDMETVFTIIEKSFLYRDTGAKIINNDLVRMDFVTKNAYELLKKAQDNKKRYIPKKEEILYFTSDRFLWDTVQVAKLKIFLTNDLNLPKDKVDNIGIHITKLIHVGYEMRYILTTLERNGVFLETKEQLNIFTSLFIQVWNHTRMVALNGYSPEEVKILEEDTQSDKKDQKVYPNALCPCGSGKKYKYCCGRK